MICQLIHLSHVTSESSPPPAILVAIWLEFRSFGRQQAQPIIADCLSMMCKLNFPVQGRSALEIEGVSVRTGH